MTDRKLGLPAIHIIRKFWQFGGKAPGRPGYRWVSGVETTTGPLGASR